jgi:hypothetical protein
MADLSPAAQAVMVAATNGNLNVVNDPVYRQCIAAALRAANAQIPPLRYAADYIEHLLAIAAELEGQPLPQPTTDNTP